MITEAKPIINCLKLKTLATLQQGYKTQAHGVSKQDDKNTNKKRGLYLIPFPQL